MGKFKVENRNHNKKEHRSARLKPERLNRTERNIGQDIRLTERKRYTPRKCGKYAGNKYTLEGEEFEGNDADWNAYLVDVLPTDEDEDRLMNEYMQQEWIQYRDWKGD